MWFLLLLACEPEVITETITLGQGLCVDGQEIVVTLAGCLSSSCDTVTGTDCEVTRAGGVIEVAASATVERQQGECTADCGLIEVRCALPADAEPGDLLVMGGDDGGPTLADAACVN